MTDYSEHIPFAEKACTFFTNSPDPYHAVENMIGRLEEAGSMIGRLEEAGFARLSKREPFADKVVPGGKYFYTVNRTTLVAFGVGSNYKPGNGFKIIGGHTDR